MYSKFLSNYFFAKERTAWAAFLKSEEKYRAGLCSEREWENSYEVWSNACFDHQRIIEDTNY